MPGQPAAPTYIDPVFVRVIAVLLALGMLAISVQPTQVAPATDVAALVDDLDDSAPLYEIVEPAVLALCEVRVVAPPPADPVPVGHCHELSVFRPPRAAAFV